MNELGEVGIVQTYSGLDIGIKKITKADLGRAKGNQTHIGLYASTVSYDFHSCSLPSYLLYDGEIKKCSGHINFIKRDDGKTNSPKIRSGEVDDSSLVNHVRSIADCESDWYLLWFISDTEVIYTILFKKDSDTQVEIQSIIGGLGASKQIKRTNQAYQPLMDRVKTEFDIREDSEDLAKEVLSTSEVDTRLREIGKRGERLVDRYLSKQRRDQKIISYEWMNKDGESKKPYDFKLILNDLSENFLDVKSTIKDFSYPWFLSHNELSKANEVSKYSIYRVFTLNAGPKLKICNNIDRLAQRFARPHGIYMEALNSLELEMIKSSILVKANPELLDFEEETEIELNH